MSWLKWGLILGGGYLGYKAITGGGASAQPAASGQAVPQHLQQPIQLIGEMRARLDPGFKWHVATSPTAVQITARNASGQQVVSKTFGSVAEALAWVKVGQPTGEQAIVNWDGVA